MHKGNQILTPIQLRYLVAMEMLHTRHIRSVLSVLSFFMVRYPALCLCYPETVEAAGSMDMPQATHQPNNPAPPCRSHWGLGAVMKCKPTVGTLMRRSSAQNGNTARVWWVALLSDSTDASEEIRLFVCFWNALWMSRRSRSASPLLHPSSVNCCLLLSRVSGGAGAYPPPPSHQGSNRDTPWICHPPFIHLWTLSNKTNVGVFGMKKGNSTVLFNTCRKTSASL